MTTIPPPGGYSAGQAPLRAPRPQEVEISFWLWIATFVLGVVGAITMYSQINQIRAEAISRVLAQNPAADQSTIESAMTTALVVGVVLGLLVVVAEIFFVFLVSSPAPVIAKNEPWLCIIARLRLSFDDHDEVFG